MNVKKEGPLKKSQEDNMNPYKLLDSYEETDANVFRGREQETESLLELVKYNFLTVVFGKSGIGKTSLLNAGLFPRLCAENFLPIRVRLNFSKDADSLKKQIRRAFEKKLAPNETDKNKITIESQIENISPTPLSDDETLWEYFSRVAHFKLTEEKEKKPVIPVLVFDQFEESFTLGKDYNEKNRKDLIDELYWLIEYQLPDPFKKKIREERQAKDKKRRALSFPTTRPEVRLIISLREDYLPQLTELKSRIPSIDRKMFRLIHLNGKQAKEVIRVGYREESVPFILHRFYPEDKRDDNKDKKESVDDEEVEVEPVFLSLLCYQLFENKPLGFISKEEVDKILEKFYDDVMQGIPDEVKIFIEEKLLTEGGFRTPFYLEPGNSLADSIDGLVNRRILRKFYDGKREYVEIIHDVLAPIIKEKRNKRLDKIREQEIKEYFKKRYYLKVIGIISFIAIIAILLAVRSCYQKRIADKQYRYAQINRLASEALLELPKDNTRAIRIAEAAYKMGLPHPPARTYQTLSAIGYSSFDKPFYKTLLKHGSPISSAVFSPDGRKILTGSKDGIVNFLDMEGKSILNFNGHKGPIKSVDFSPDGTKFLTTFLYNNSVILWDMGGKPFAELKHKRVVSSAVFSHDGSRILTASHDGIARLWDMNKKLLAEFEHKPAINSAVFSPDGKRIITASWDKSAKLWDIEGKLLIELKHDDEVSSAVFSPGRDSKRILTASKDHTSVLWNIAGNPLITLKHKGPVNSAVFSPDGKRILTASEDQTSILWNLAGSPLIELKHEGPVNSAVFSPDGKQILTICEDGTAKIWTLESNLLVDLNKHTAGVNTAVFSSDDRLVLTASSDGTARLWDMEGNSKMELKHKGPVKLAAFSPDGERILTTSTDRTSILWDMEGNSLIELIQNRPVNSAVFSPDGKKILTTTDDGTARLWDLKGNLVTKLKGHRGVIISTLFSPNGRRILTTADDYTVKLWDLEGNLLAEPKKSKGFLISAVFSPDGKKILTNTDDGTAKLWDLKGNLVAELRGHRGGIISTLFSPNGRRILTTADDYTARLWDLKGNLLAELNKHKDAVTSALFSHDGNLILTASRDGTAKVWYTPGAIFDWLKTTKISRLSKKDKKKLEIRGAYND